MICSSICLYCCDTTVTPFASLFHTDNGHKNWEGLAHNGDIFNKEELNAALPVTFYLCYLFKEDNLELMHLVKSLRFKGLGLNGWMKTCSKLDLPKITHFHTASRAANIEVGSEECGSVLPCPCTEGPPSERAVAPVRSAERGESGTESLHPCPLLLQL